MSKEEIQLLAKCVQATEENKVVYTTEKEHEKLLALGCLEINKEYIDDGGKIGTRATKKGATVLATLMADEKVEEKEEEIELETGIELPPIVRAKRSKYPFELMEVGQSFHVPTTQENSNPLRRMRSNANVFNHKHKNEDGTWSKKWVVRAAQDDDPKGEGARVFRVK